MIDADHAGRLAHGAGDGKGVVAADGPAEVADADQRAVLLQRRELRVGEVARAVAGGLDAGVRDDHGPGGRGEDVVHRLRGGVGEVDDDLPLLQLAQPVAAQRAEAAVADAVGGAADLGVGEVGRRHHAEAGVVEHVHRSEVAFQRLRALERQQRAHRLRPKRPLGEQRLQLRAGAHRHQGSAAALLHLPQPQGLEEGAGAPARPGGPRPARDEGEGSDHVGRGRLVARDVHAQRRLGDGAKHLEGRPGFLQPRHVHLPARGALQQISAPQQWVGVQVHRVAHQLPRPRLRGIGRTLPDAVERALDERRQKGEGEEEEQGERREGESELAHGCTHRMKGVRSPPP